MQDCFDWKLIEVRHWIAFLTICVLAMPLNGQAPARPQNGKSPSPQSRAEQRIAISSSFERQIYQGQTLQAQGQYSAAKRIFLGALSSSERCDPNSVETAFALDNLASIIAEEGHFFEAQGLYTRALGILEKQLGIENEASVRVMLHLAGVYTERGQYSQADALLRRGMALFTQLGVEDPLFAEMLDSLGAVDAQRADYSEAITLFNRALQTLQKTRATFNPRMGTRQEEMALILIDLASASARLERYAEAVDEAERARDLLRSLSDPPPRAMVKVLTTLSGLYARTARASEAESTMAQVLSMAEATYGTEDLCVADVLESYAAVLRQLNRKHEAKALQKRAKVIERNASRQDYGRLTINVMSLH